MKAKKYSKRTYFTVNPNVYSKEAIFSTCYLFLKRFYVFLDEEDGHVKIALKPKRNVRLNSKICEGEFRNKLLHAQLRYEVSKNNRKIREYIIGRALYSAITPSGDDLFSSSDELDYQKDPLGITIPWEEKYGRKTEKNAGAKIQ